MSVRTGLLDKAMKYSMALAALYDAEEEGPPKADNPRDRYILVLGAEVVRLREKLEKLGAVMRDEPEDDD